jgi:hypothetical protein
VAMVHIQKFELWHGFWEPSSFSSGVLNGKRLRGFSAGDPSVLALWPPEFKQANEPIEPFGVRAKSESNNPFEGTMESEEEEKTSLCLQAGSSTIRKCGCRRRCPDTPGRRWNFLQHANTAICTTIFIILMFTILRPSPSLTLPERQFHPVITKPVGYNGPTSCSTSISEAQPLGCSFELLAKAWLPVDCPRYGLDDFIQAGYSYPN